MNLDDKNLAVKTILDNVSLNVENNNYSIKAFNAKHEELALEKKIGTASTLEVVDTKNNFTIDKMTVVLYGDTNGDGAITSSDALAIIKNRTNKIKFENQYYTEAGRITSATRENNAIPSSSDALAIIKHILNKRKIEQFYNMQVTVSSYNELYQQLEQCNTNIKFDTNASNYKQMSDNYQKLKDIVAKYCNSSMSQTTKALVLHDYLVAGTKLHYNIPYNAKLDEAESNIENIGKTMNQLGFANTYTALLGIAGIPSKIVDDRYANHPDTTVNQVTIDGEMYYVACGADSYISQVEGKEKIRRYYFLRNSEQLGYTFWEDEAFFDYAPYTTETSTSTKYCGVRWPDYRATLDYKDSEIKLANGKKIVRNITELKEALLKKEAYVIDIYDADTELLNEQDQFCQKVIAKYIKPGMSEAERALEIHDYICSNFTRSDHESIRNRKDLTNKEYDRAWGYYKTSLLSGLGDCISATNSFNTLCAYAGIETKTINEFQIDYPFGGGNHHWSLVKIDGQWYHCDCEGADYWQYGTVDRTWFLYSDKGMQAREGSNTLQPCTSTKYDKYNWPEFKGVDYYQDRTGITEGNVPVTDFWIKEKTETVIGDSYNLQIRLFPFGANSKVNYSSSNPSVASIDEKGQVTTKQSGSTKIIVTVDGKTKSYDLKVGVKPEKIVLDPLTLKVGEKKIATFTVTPTNAIYDIDGWYTYNYDKDIITIDEEGYVTAVGEGTTTIQLSYSYVMGNCRYIEDASAKVTVTK